MAIKVLPAHLKDDADLRQRFLREAQAVAALEHPHICALHDIGLEPEGLADFLIMECLEGETLARRLEKGPLSLDHSLRYAIEISGALDHAHRQGIVHRDLKPGNIMLTKSGAKLLDFGLAKLRPAASVAFAGVTAATRTAPLTSQGSILGTLQYMAPEQLEGNEADARSDIFAFGAVLYEMVTGAKAFSGPSQASLIAAILEHEPPAISTLRSMTPLLDQIVRRCLAKNPGDRWQTTADLRFALASIGSALPAAVTDSARIPERERHTNLAWRIAVGSLVVAAVSTGLALFAWTRSTATPSAQVPVRLLLSEQVPPRTDDPVPSFALSADGSRVVYAAESGGLRRLYFRELQSLEATPIAGTDNGTFPFFSPDGRRIGFFSEAKLKVVALTGGAPIVLDTITNVRGATWAPDDTIIYTRGADDGLWQVSAAGGPPRQLARPDSSKGERGYRWPALLPGGDAVLFTVATSDILSFDEAQVEVRLLRTGEQHEVIRGGTFATYAATGDLLYARAGALLAVPFDAKRLTVTGAARPVLDGIVTSPVNGAAQYALSPNGTLLYVAGKLEAAERALSWVDRSGRTSRITVAPADYLSARIAPDGHRAALEIDGANDTLWILDLDRTTMTRLTYEWNNNNELWTPDGTRMAFASSRGGGTTLFWQRVDGQGNAEPLFPAGQFAGLGQVSWSPDGRTLVFAASSARTGFDLWIMPLDGHRTPKPLLQTAFEEMQPAISPNGHWLAYVSNETGRAEVYVQPYPGPGRKTRISIDGGLQPVWARSGRELFYRNGDAMMAVAIDMSPSFSPRRPQLLFRKASTHPYDVSSDGRFLMIEDLPSETTARPVTVVLNWVQELQHPSPVAR